jgi:ribosomal protein S18 acetylase RimI-like enzyme
MTTTTIRCARVTDVPAVLALWHASGAEPTHTDDAGSLLRLIDHDPAALVVAEAERRVVGSVIAAWDGWRGSIYRLVVAPAHRGEGLGRRLVRAAEQRLADAGALRMQAIVAGTDARATGFWRATGWEEQVARRRFVQG